MPTPNEYHCRDVGIEMRIEQLVMYGPHDDDRIRFSPRVNVFGGLSPDERTDFVTTFIDALSGRLANATVVYTDEQGRRVYSDRMGATFADSGERATAPHEILGQDAASARRLLTLTGPDLGLGTPVTAERLRAELADARLTLDRRRVELSEIKDQRDEIAKWEAELRLLDEHIAGHEDAVARWEWLTRRRRLDQLRAELNLTEQAKEGRTDRQILDAVEALRSLGAAWMNLATETTTMRSELGPLPAVSLANLELVAATPAGRPTDFATRLDSWRSAADLRRSAEEDVARRSSAPTPPEDALVVAFAELDQETLWSRHAALVEANDVYQQHAPAGAATELSAENEDRIEAAHLEVVRCQREVERRTTTGLIVGGVLFGLGLLASQMVAPALGGAVIIAALVVVAAFVVVPRRRLSAAEAVEQTALETSGAESWLGMHLRRLDSLTDTDDRRRFERIAKARAAAQVAWDEIAGAVSPQDLTDRAAAVRAHAEAIDPKLAARKLEEARKFAAAASQTERAARRALTNGMERYGFTPDSLARMDPDLLDELLDRRIAAGDVARRARHLAMLSEREAEAGRRLGELLNQLGFGEGTLENRMERAVAAVASARDREANGGRDVGELKAELTTLTDELRATFRANWANTPEPTASPRERSLLDARREDLTELLGSAARPDPAAALSRVEAASSVVDSLEERLDGLTTGRSSLRDRLNSRLGRTSALSGVEQSVPVVIDDAFRHADPSMRIELLEQVLSASEHVQVMFLTDDPEVSTWARDRGTAAGVVLYQAEPPAAQERIGSVPHSARIP